MSTYETDPPVDTEEFSEEFSEEFREEFDEANESVAIVGMALRFPGARDVETFWQNLRKGVESIRFLSEEELLAAGVDEALTRRSDYVPAAAVLDGYDRFDAAFFDFGPREGAILDPQDRHFLECTHEALERAGYDPARYPGAIGVFAGEGMNSYLMFNLQSDPRLVDTFGWLQLRFSNDKDFLTTLASYKLNLRGPSVCVQTACSTSLVAVHLARESLLAGQCDLAIAGGVTINVPHGRGYLWQEGSIASPDGHCRAFDAAGAGTLPGEGVGVVVLKRLDEAIEDGDHIHGVIRGSAVNNDGNAKIGYTAPSVDGQAEVIATALGVAGLGAEEIGYVEAHGTATRMGDPVEVAALVRAFRESSGPDAEVGYCALGSVKTNFGHLDSAAGVAGLIKATLAVERGEIPPSLHYERPNPEIDFASSPFFVADRLIEWPGADEGAPRRAGVSSFGIGGTNAHAIVEEPPAPEPGSPARSRQLVLLSAKSRAALDAATRRLADHLEDQARLETQGRLENQELEAADVAYTLAVGRSQMPYRRILVADSSLEDSSLADMAEGLRDERRALAALAPDTPPGVVFLFPGQGAQYPSMARRLREEEPVFRDALERCAAILAERAEVDLFAALHIDQVSSGGSPEAAEDAARALRDTALAQPALFAVEWSLAELWKHWGVEPVALLGHSVGELVAACRAGTIALEDALELVALRGRLMAAMEPGAMLALPLSEAETRERIAGAADVETAVANADDLTVVGGPIPAIDALEESLRTEGLDVRRLHVSHAFHTAMMEPMLDELRAFCARLPLAAPSVPWISNVTGTWITREQAIDPGYWAEHVRSTVRFAAGVTTARGTAAEDPDVVFLEVGPGGVLCDLVRRHQRPTADRAAGGRASTLRATAIASLGGPKDEANDLATIYEAVGRLWLAGVAIDAAALYADQRRRRVPLPTYPFESRRLWIDALPTAARSVPTDAVGSWLHTPLWQQTRPARPAPSAEPGRWLVLVDESGLGETIAERLAAAGETVATLRRSEALHDALAARDDRPWRIVHAWSLDLDPGLLDPSPDRAPDQILELAAESLVDLVDALEAEEVVLLTDGARSVTEPGAPAAVGAVFLAACRAVQRKAPRVRCRTIDLRLGPDASSRLDDLPDRLVAELRCESREPVVAYRHGRRWRRTFEPLALSGFHARDSDAAGRLRPAGVYALLDGLSPAGLAVAAHLSRVVDARLVLVDALGEDDLDAESTHALELLRARAEVEIQRFAVQDGLDAALGTALGAGRERFGALHGVLALSAHPRSLAEDAARARALESLDPALDFCLLLPAPYAAGDDVHGLHATTRSLLAEAWAAAVPAPTITIRFRGRLDPAVDARELVEVVRHALAIDDIDHFLVDLHDLRQSLTPAHDESEETAVEPESAPGRAHVLTPYAAPRDETERALCVLWSEILGVDPVGVDDGFFDLGGHSLLATRLAARIGEHFGVRLPTAELVAAPTVGELARVVDSLRRARSESEDGHESGDGAAPAALALDADLPRVVPDPENRHEPFPLTDVQQAYWIGRSGAVDLGDVATHAYLEIDADSLDVERFETAWRTLVERHEMLRAIVTDDGYQRVLRDDERPAFALPVHDLRTLGEDEVEAALAARRETLSHKVHPSDQWPLFDLEVSRLPGGRARVHFGMDLLIADGWSFSILSREASHFYERPDEPLPALELGFRDYVLGEIDLRETAPYARALEYWRDRLATLPPAPELPVQPPAPGADTRTFTRRELVLEADTWSRLVRRAGRAGVSPPGVLLAAFSQVLAFWSKGQHMTLNLTLFNRLPLHEQVNELVGDFTSLTLLEVDLRRARAFEARAKALQEQLWRDLDHRHVSGVWVMRELARAAGGTGGVAMPVVFTSMLGFDTAGGADRTPFGVPGEISFTITQTPQVWLDHQVAETADGDLALVWDSVDAIFPDGLLDDMFAAYRRLLYQLADEETAWRRESFDLLPARHARHLETVNATDAPVPEGLLHPPIYERAAERPDALAVVDPADSLTYRQLTSLAHRLAVELRRHAGVRPGALVAVVLPKGRFQAAATLGILDAGAAYLPIDPGQPRERVWYLLDEARVEVLVTDAEHDRELAWPTDVARVVIDDLAWNPEDSSPPPAPLEPAQRADDLAYVIFTSGSTGRPKGVMIDHRGAKNTCVDVNRRYDVGPDDAVFALSALNFDLSVWDLFGVLAAGGTVVMPDPAERREPEHWLALLEAHGVTVWNSVPALVQMLVDYALDTGRELPASLRLCLMSGDWIPVSLPDRLRRLRPEIEIVSMGGATEASIWSILYDVGEVDPEWKSIPYGRPMTNQRFHVFSQSETLEPRPEWVVGDLYIGGVGLAGGYWRDLEKTRAAFLHHPTTGERLYRTGDLGRWLPSGEIEFLGREDTQVKVQGHRIELGEIEAVLGQVPGVAHGVVVAVGERRGSKRLVGYVVLDPDVDLPGTGAPAERLRAALAESLPSYMVPTTFALLQSLPLSANGKVDRKALPAPEVAERASVRVEPRSPLEEALVGAFSEVLGERPSVEDNFFELGGDSVLATRALARIRGLFPVEIGLRDLFEAPTVAGLAEVIDARMVERLESMSDEEAAALLGGDA